VTLTSPAAWALLFGATRWMRRVKNDSTCQGPGGKGAPGNGWGFQKDGRSLPWVFPQCPHVTNVADKGEVGFKV
jgi:hypothetical protein